MAIRMRRGNEADFDPEKMLPGEWAVSTDTKYVRMCFAPGIVLRMATYEAFESDMAEIRKILSECQSIQTAVELIQKNVTNSELVIENYVKEAKQYRDEAEQYRNETEQFRNEAFSTTSGLIINNTASGDNIHLTDSAKSKVLAFGLYGKSEQNGTPTPDSPIEIIVAGGNGSVEVKSVGKNLIPYPYYEKSKTYAGITYDVKSNGIIVITGKSTGSYYNLRSRNVADENPLILPAGTYSISGCPQGGSSNMYLIQVSKTGVDGANEVICWDTGKGATFTITEETQLQVGIVVSANCPEIITPITFKIMIRPLNIGDDTYEQYKENKVTISTPTGIAGIPVDSEGNYTDENGQQWICDEIVKYADGTGKRIQRIGMRIQDGTTNKAGFYGTTTGASGESLIQINLGSGDIKPVTRYSPYMLCDKLQASTTRRANVIMLYPYSSEITIPVVLLDSNEDIKSLDEANAWLRNNPLTTYYILAEPVETDLTADEIEAFESLQTFYPVTNISNNANCGMSITYVADTKNYIDSKIASLEKALYNNI